MAKHPLRLAIEARVTDDELVSLLADDVVIYLPMLTEPLRGSKNVARILSAAARIVGPIEYEHELNDGNQTFLIWKGTAGGFPLEAATILTDDPDGLITEIRVVMRPWPVVTFFRNAMYDELSAVIGASGLSVISPPVPFSNG